MDWRNGMKSSVLDVSALIDFVEEVSVDCFVNSLTGEDCFSGMEYVGDGIVVADVFENGDSVYFRLVSSPGSSSESGWQEWVFSVDGFEGFWSIKGEPSGFEMFYGSSESLIRKVEKAVEVVDVWVPVM